MDSKTKMAIIEKMVDPQPAKCTPCPHPFEEERRPFAIITPKDDGYFCIYLYDKDGVFESPDHAAGQVQFAFTIHVE